MRNSFKFGLLALAIAASISSCGDGDRANHGSKPDSEKTAIDTASKTIDTAKAAVDTAKKDSVKK